MSDSLKQLQSQVSQCMLADRFKLQRRLHNLARQARLGKAIDKGLSQISQSIQQSSERYAARLQALPKPSFDPQLPINQRRDDIAAAIQNNQIVVICGETGSGKTTQIPKICLELGFGAAGLIGHTQPRRIAARSVANRIAEELHTELGKSIGYKVRFSDRIGPNTAVKLMTDGILLAETQSDRWLNQYQVIIIDEAHERSLNIDFLLGYLHRLLPKRPDLKLIITSATIDPERFSKHFSNAPIIEVSGRSYPVDIHYQPLLTEDEDERDRDLQQAIVDAVDEVSRIDRGDILIFLSGEREIRETSESLHKHKLPNTVVLPLYARLSAAEQNRVLQTGSQRRIVLATNVAETSLTVPGIRYVIDPGSARISRYSHRSKVQRLPVEKISQASAAQRAGRCGRVAPGVCLRLYAEEDFNAREEFTQPEILRTNLAAVILQMCVLRLGDVEDFPFIDPPDRRLINDGFKLLFELHAVDEKHRVTALGQQLARLPIDPRLGRMILAAQDEGCLKEVLVITSALAIQDPRERPLDHQQAADEKQRRFIDEKSDFSALLNLWNYIQEQGQHLSKNKLRQLCHQEFLSYVRLREWRELHQELHRLVTEMGFQLNTEDCGYNELHRALLTGLLGNIGNKTEEPTKGKRHNTVWLGARGGKFYIFPGSGLSKKAPKWLMAAELVETSRLYARTVARIQPEWIEQLAPHLIKRSYSAPHWEKRAGQVAAKERVTLYGLPLIVNRKVNYGPIDPTFSREIFIRDALVGQDFFSTAPFFLHNRKLIADIENLEAKGRRRDLLADEETLYQFYDQRIPSGIYNTPRFERWRRNAEHDDPELLFLNREQMLQQDIAADFSQQFPDHLNLGGAELPLSYCFEPNSEQDGVTLTVPLEMLNQLRPERLQWLVPGLLPQRMAALLKSLPKSLRKHFVPVPNYVTTLLESLQANDTALTTAMAAELVRITGVEVPESEWRAETIPEHLKLRLRVLDSDGNTVAIGRDPEALQERLKSKAEQSFATLAIPQFEREHINNWDFGDLPEVIKFERNGVQLKGYPALVVEENKLALRLLDTADKAYVAHRIGLRKLLRLRLRDKIQYLKRNLPDLLIMSLHYVGVGTQTDLIDDLIDTVIDRAFYADKPIPRTRPDYDACLQRGREQMIAVADEVCELAKQILEIHHRIRTRLNEHIPKNWQIAVNDIREQVDHLVYKGFLAQTPYQWLQQLPRYLTAIELRLDKLSYGSEKDQQRLADIARLWQDCKKQVEFNNNKGLRDPELETFRWMLEELRVSQFAQELKTLRPVSVKRLEAQWLKVA